MNIDSEQIDNQKLVYHHPRRVTDWLEGKQAYPIYAEISLTNLCNHDCLFCAPNFTRKEKATLDTKIIKRALSSMANVGVKAIMFGGEGEPLLHKDIGEITEYAKSLNLDVALTTNGVLFNQKIAMQMLPHLSWVKFSVDSGNVNTYKRLHGTKDIDFKTVLDNISRSKFLVKLKKWDCTVGVQALLFKENLKDLSYLANVLRNIHADYLVLKPFSEHDKRIGDELESPTEREIDILMEQLKPYETDEFKIILRRNAIIDVNRKKPYNKCYAQDFMAYIDSYGGVHSCINYIDDADYTYGDINERTFDEIWKHKPFINPNLDNCRTVCRLDLMNRYLYNLKNPHKHNNFI